MKKRSRSAGSGIISMLLGLVLLLAAAPAQAAPARPYDEMKTTLDALLDVINKFPGDSNKSTRREKMRDILTPRFDFKEMSRRSLGSHWLKCNEAEREEFVDVFSKLLAHTYLSKVDGLKENMVTIDKELIKPPKALVKTRVNHEGDIFPLDYKLIQVGDSWKVYDIVIENIGLISNYRNEFSGIIRKEKFSGLINRLKAKVSSPS